MWHQVIEDARAGSLRPIYRAPFGPPQPGVATRRDLFKKKRYLPVTLLQFGRGCRFRCEYCAVGTYFDHHQYVRPVDEVVAEIEAQGRRNLFFVDDNILADFEAAKELFRALIPLKVRWVSQATIDQTEDRELMDLMVESGCLGNVIGFETLDERNLVAMNKRSNLRGGFERYEDQIEILRDYGLQTWAAFLLGYDHDTVETFENTLEFAIRNRLFLANFNPLAPTPGAALHARLRAEGRPIHDPWWLHEDYRYGQSMFHPRRMAASAP